MIHAEWMVAIDIKRLYIHRVMPRECSVIQKPFHFFKRLRLRTFKDRSRGGNTHRMKA